MGLEVRPNVYPASQERGETPKPVDHVVSGVIIGYRERHLEQLVTQLSNESISADTAAHIFISDNGSSLGINGHQEIAEDIAYASLILTDKIKIANRRAYFNEIIDTSKTLLTSKEGSEERKVIVKDTQGKLKKLAIKKGSREEAAIATRLLYARIFLGEFDKGNIDFHIVDGSTKGVFGSARAYGIKAVLDYFRKLHPKLDPKRHFVITQMDSDNSYTGNLVTSITQTIKTFPETEEILAPMPASGPAPKGEWAGWRGNPLWQAIMNTYGLSRVFRAEGRRGNHFMHTGQDKLGRIFHTTAPTVGPFSCIRMDSLQKTFEDYTKKQGIEAEDEALKFFSQAKVGEDGWHTFIVQRIIDALHVHDVREAGADLRILYDMRGRETLAKIARTLVGFMQDSILEPHTTRHLSETGQITQPTLEELTTYQGYVQVIGELIRHIDEQTFGLERDQFVQRVKDSKSEHNKPQSLVKAQQEYERLGFDAEIKRSPEKNPYTGKWEYALVVRGPDKARIADYDHGRQDPQNLPTLRDLLSQNPTLYIAREVSLHYSNIGGKIGGKRLHAIHGERIGVFVDKNGQKHFLLLRYHKPFLKETIEPVVGSADAAYRRRG